VIHIEMTINKGFFNLPHVDEKIVFHTSTPEIRGGVSQLLPPVWGISRWVTIYRVPGLSYRLTGGVAGKRTHLV